MIINTANQKQIHDLAEVLWSYHKLNDPLEKSDLIICLGSLDKRSAWRAAEVFNEGLAPLIIFTGGIAHQHDELRTTWDEPEAVVFAKEAIERGVPEENIILETEAKNTGENIKNTYKIIKDKNLKANKIILVQKPYMGKRTYATFKKQWPDSVTEISVTSLDISFEEYFNVELDEQEKIIHLMIGDLQRIKIYPEKGFQIPLEIPDEVWNAYNKLVELGFTKHLI